MQEVTLKGRPCSVAGALTVVGDRWSLLAVREVAFGNHRFSEIARNTGAPRDRLAARLRALVDAGVLDKRKYQDKPDRFSYHLSPAGRALMPVLEALKQWGDEFVMDSPPMELRHHDHVFRGVWTCSECGGRIRSGDLHRQVLADGWDLSGPLPAV
jgi:DNA-binding HxlR family transcriptional regulator